MRLKRPRDNRRFAFAGCRVLAVAALAAAWLWSVSLADDNAQAMRAFGLIGAWSPDCRQDAAKGGMRFIYETAPSGTARLRFTAIGQAIEFEILSAVIIGKDRIALAYRLNAASQRMPTAPHTDRPFRASLARAQPDKLLLDDPVMAGPAPVPLLRCRP